MPLENDGGSGTSGSHWEYMALQEDTMTAAGTTIELIFILLIID